MSASTIRSWASQGLLRRVGTAQRRALYRLADVYEIATQRRSEADVMKTVDPAAVWDAGWLARDLGVSANPYR